jgi:hypothetical protein
VPSLCLGKYTQSDNKFNVETLDEDLEKVGYKMHPGLKAFLKEYPDPSRINEISAHQKWAELVTGWEGVSNAPFHPGLQLQRGD